MAISKVALMLDILNLLPERETFERCQFLLHFLAMVRSVAGRTKAINEALHQIMERREEVVQIGVGVNTPWYVGQTMKGLLDRYGEDRLMDTPVSESCITGVAVGASMTGMRSILTFPRMDFMYYAMDQLCNHAAILNYSLGGKTPVKLTVRAIINRGGEQAAQHSQATQAIFMHIPGFRVIAPSNPRDAKGMLAAAVEFGSPVIYVEDRWLYNEQGEVPEEYYTTSLDKAEIMRPGSDLTLISSSFMLIECLKAASDLDAEGIRAEVIDLRILKPIDEKTLLESVERTGRVLVVDGGWKTCGVAAEISAIIGSKGFRHLKAPVERVTLPDIPAPASRTLERAYYPDKEIIKNKIKEIVSYTR